jgi:hypothetical protein
MRNTRKEIKRQYIVIDNKTLEHASLFKYLESIVNETIQIGLQLEKGHTMQIRNC